MTMIWKGVEWKKRLVGREREARHGCCAAQFELEAFAAAWINDMLVVLASSLAVLWTSACFSAF